MILTYGVKEELWPDGILEAVFTDVEARDATFDKEVYVRSLPEQLIEQDLRTDARFRWKAVPRDALYMKIRLSQELIYDMPAGRLNEYLSSLLLAQLP